MSEVKLGLLQEKMKGCEFKFVKSHQQTVDGFICYHSITHDLRVKHDKENLLSAKYCGYGK